MKIKLFKQVYIAGIALSFFLSIPFAFNRFLSQQNSNTDFGYLVFFVGVAHMIVLSIIGFKLKENNNKSSAGYRIQTAGYLHTLIGFTGALLQLDTTNLLETIVTPLSYALVTSIIGWFVGGELVNEANEEESNILETEVKRISRELKSFADELSVIQHKYIEKIESVSNSLEEHISKVNVSYSRMLDTSEITLERLSKQQIALLNQLNLYQTKFIESQQKCYNSMNEANTKTINASDVLSNSINNFASSLSSSELSQISISAKELNDQTTLAAQQMKELAIQSSDAANYLQNSHVLIKQLEELIHWISNPRRSV